MDRRSFFRFLPAAVVGVALGVPAAKTAWGEGIPAMLKAWGIPDRKFTLGEALERAERMFDEAIATKYYKRVVFRPRKLTPEQREEFTRVYIETRATLDESPTLRSYIDGCLRIDLQRLRETQELLSNYHTT